ncbi:diguanylate cyclase [uncultured Jatrophihabitans sp.]|uniref:GGDEF domain-containing protein n=1 Tax=uncultured Jatrophihabitans sp. TaxID=1610747 RepID=UPI0035CB33B7
MNSPVASPRRRAATAEEISALRVTEVELFSVAGHDGYLREVNSAFAQLLGRQPDVVHGSSLLELVHPEDLPAVVAAVSALEGGAAEVQVENRFARADGSWFHLHWVARPIEGTELWWAAGRDTSEVHRLLLERSHLQTRLELSIGQATAAMWELSIGTGQLTWEPHAAELFAAADEPPADVTAFGALVDPRDRDAVASGFANLATCGSVEVAARIGADLTTRHLSLRGKVLDRDRRGRAVRAVGLVLDVTTEKAMEEQMLRMIMSDGLTGVPNRRAFDQALRTQWRRCIREAVPVSVAMVDIDNFKLFNDTFGHLVGDEVLCSVARTLANALREEHDLLARFGGEEFAIVLAGADRDAAHSTATRLVEAVRCVTLRQAPDWRLSVSIGTCSWQPGEAVMKSGDALGRADRALYAAKQAGKDRAATAG